ncbi:MAG: 16S rRNA processing protein RimM [Clostridia bacterium]|nr:16S rRNA processing protein RimM [Clostridia bacterium]
MRKLSEYIEIGRITNTHGIKGEMKVEYWMDSAQDFLSLRTVYLKDGSALNVLSSRNANRFAVVLFEGITDPEKGAGYKGRSLYAKRSDLKLGEGSYFLCDLIGLPVFDIDTEEQVGCVTDILEKPSSYVYTVKTDNGEFLVPAIDEFIKKVDIENGVYIKVIPGLLE